MHIEYLRGLFLHNDLAEGRFQVAGRPLALDDIKLPMFVVGTERDHIAPWHSVFKLHLLNDGELTFVLTSGGHNAGIVSEPGHPHRHFRIRVRDAGARTLGPGRMGTRHRAAGRILVAGVGRMARQRIRRAASIRRRWARPASCRSATPPALTCCEG